MRAQREEASEEVWAAALGCLLHLATAKGAPQPAALAGLPMAALATLLSRCSTYGWCGLTGVWGPRYRQREADALLANLSGPLRLPRALTACLHQKGPALHQRLNGGAAWG